MDEFVSKIKEGAVKVMEEAEKLTSDAVTKTGNAVNKAKLNYAIRNNETKIKDILADIGSTVYKEYKNGSDFPEDIAQKLKTVENLYDEIIELKTKIADMTNSVVCPECREYNSENSTYCSTCGYKIK